MKQTQLNTPQPQATKAKATARGRFARKPKQKEEVKYSCCSCTGIGNMAAAQEHGLHYCTSDHAHGLKTISEIRKLQIAAGRISG